MTLDLTPTSREALVEAGFPTLPSPRSHWGNKGVSPQKLHPDPLRGPPGRGSLRRAGRLRAFGRALRKPQGEGSLASTLMAQNLGSGGVSFPGVVTPNLCPEATRAVRDRSQMLQGDLLQGGAKL